jgi:tetratricopeptide (TPR) repeat protein
MVAQVSAHSWRTGRRNRLLLLLLSLVLAFAGSAASKAVPLQGSVTAEADDGYARLVFVLSDDVDATARIAGNVLIVTFAKPVSISVDSLPAQAPGYIGAARRDPDGRAIRLALTRKLTVNSIAAAEKLFVDLLPDTWNGPPPGLPQDVVEDLAHRAREAERLEHLAQQKEKQRKLAPVPVHIASLPTFTRYVFDVPDQTSVSADRAKERLTLTFDAPIPFDLSDAEAALPATITSIKAEVESDSALVRFSFPNAVDVRTFRDGKGYVVDILNGEAAATMHEKAAAGVSLPPFMEVGPSVKPLAMETGKPSLAPPPIAAQIPPAAAETAAPATRFTPTPPEAAAPAARVPPTPPETVAPVTWVEPTPPKMPKTSEGRRLQSAPAAAPTQPAAIVAPTHPPNAETPTEPAKSGPSASSPSPVVAPLRQSKPGDTVAVEISHYGANLKLSFPFGTPTAAAVFHRADTLWIVFDSKSAIDLTALDGEPSRTIRGAEFVREGDAGVVRLRLGHPHLSSVVAEGQGWTLTIGDNVADPTRALDITRNLIGPNRASVTIIFDEPHQLHRIRDPEAGDDLLVVTGFAPARGFINEQDFVEFRALASTQGAVIEPLADDLSVDLARDKIVVTRPSGLTLSSSLQSVLHGSALRPLMFDAQVWGLDRQSNYSDRQSQLLTAAASALPGKRLAQRLDLARFYIARDMYQEAKAVLDVALAGDRPVAEDVTGSVLRAAAEVMINRPDDALKDLGSPAIGDQHDAPLWRALAYACQGKWGLARDSFKRVEASIATLPIELQREALKSAMRADIEVGDFSGAATELNDLETIGLPRELQPSISVLVGRLSEGMGRNEEALTAYRTAADSWDRPAAAQGRLRATSLRYSLGDLKRDEVISELETLTAIWRGDETEIGALEILARLYTEEGRYRDSFHVMRNAVSAHPESDMTRRIQGEAAATFDTLFLAGKVDTFSAIDALALFYDFRELTPIGRRGDEMIRRLADRLVSVDLLDQAAELLQYQVDRRLQGAARAQVAARLAVV